MLNSQFFARIYARLFLRLYKDPPVDQRMYVACLHVLDFLNTNNKQNNNAAFFLLIAKIKVT